MIRYGYGLARDRRYELGHSGRTFCGDMHRVRARAAPDQWTDGPLAGYELVHT
jgi:hypothetical protein